MGTHFRERRSFVETPAGFLDRLDDMIEKLIAMRDDLDGDADFEMEPDDENGLNELYASQSQEVSDIWRGAIDHDDDEDGHDAEEGCDTENDKSDDEPSMGWSESESLTGALTAGNCLGEDEASDEDGDIADMPHDDDEREPSAAGTRDDR